MSTSPNSPPLICLRNLLLLAAWALALFGTLQVQLWEDWLGHAICGPWGCGPPVSALIGYHGFWLLVLLLPAWLLKQQLSSPALQRLGMGLFLLAAVGVVLLLSIDSWQHWQHERIRPYLVQRLLFRLATFIDFPLVQLGLIGLWLCSPQLPTEQVVASEPDEHSLH